MPFLCLLLIPVILCCGRKGTTSERPAVFADSSQQELADTNLRIAANRTEAYFPLLKGKKVGLVANQTSVIFSDARETGIETNYTHLADSLLSAGIDLVKVFAPEHGFRGTADAGEEVEDGVDRRSGLPVISLYGQNRKPSKTHLEGLDLVVFDIQDVGVRFYTYIATLQLVMEACAETGIPVMVLDRPNPNAQYVDGPTMEPHLTGFLGLNLIPLVYGMTIGEYATMVNGEGWMDNEIKADLTVIPMENYRHDATYSLPIKPSPNLPNDKAVNLYPSLGLFEGTNINAGRGTDGQFQRYGAPFLNKEVFTFRYTPEPNPGAKNPKHLGEVCYGQDLSTEPELRKVSLEYILKAYRNCDRKDLFFNTSGFSKHAGTEKLQKQIEAGLSEEEIRMTWKTDLDAFQKIRSKYLLYP
ncbi:exo-beta-N-acetylmuramidase NamZ family protein [Muriicola marianensis]|uniref:exo-beta-N-acetylmuramidase NamZ family protein n=1 Tax=Muriicola marianensis TaxID=1324801 RepID=UPI0016638AA2